MEKDTKIELVGLLSQLMTLSELIGHTAALGQTERSERYAADRLEIAGRLRVLLELES